MNLNISKDKFLAFLVVGFFLFAFLIGSYIPVILAVILCYKSIFDLKISIIVCCVMSLYFVFLGFETIKFFILMFFSIIFISERFKNNPKNILLAYSIVFTPFLIYLLTLDQLSGNLSDVLAFERRFWPIFKNGEEFNPNTIGLLSALCAFGFYVNKKYFLILLPLFFMLITQSRSAILFFVLSVLIYSEFKIRNIFNFVFVFGVLSYFISSTNIIKRFMESGDNGRIERAGLYFYYLKNNLMTGIGYTEYKKLIQYMGTWDNLYLSLFLVYGVFGIIFILLLLLMFLINSKDEYYRIRLAIFISFLVLGLFEGSFAFNYLTWAVFALSFNSFSFRRVG